MSLRTAAAEQHDRARPPLTVAVLPARAAYDYEFVAARLHDQSLLPRSVAVRIFRIPLLAVPVGGCRRGGRIDAGPAAVALAVRDALLGRPGFPMARVSLSGESWFVEWGERPPDRPALDARERLHFFGYSASSLTAECPQQPPHAPLAAVSADNDLPVHQRARDSRGEPMGEGSQ
ncbi:DUF6302 family protein [Streptomyces sp. H39-C1]|uniref:DUF6302 family protein n=1 Tax=Streptomyces sp. H39-C1 TaxID=3004355 RepID=UPI0022AEF281|nr:DUF6302 family protein [Streptomyces sp. H39-C1]MCZ4098288.1 DUF6302 family protein [Streptomyces sp. H39-C1]